MKELKIIETEDGSHSLFVPSLNETYHSFHGALQESRHVFINMGLQYFVEKYAVKKVSILEIGFGTGLNTILTIGSAIERAFEIKYTTLEPHPISKDIIGQLNYTSLLNEKKLELQFNRIHDCPWGDSVLILDNFTLRKEKLKLENYTSAPASFDIVYYDAFAPSKQAELWTLEIIKKVAGFMKPGGVLVTYCAKGQFKRDLKEAEFTVETLPGPPGKKEMVRGIKQLIPFS
ncbi:tRNA (5-methylaminomethyl-2-thiouridine)(34)-methyltransferase MnmD [Fulvivirgaceae bacterium BMA10]|uniref:tRNA (5-methylaminomethyl-2-thiouridine)(34)-methyltransferase MnmD n=1 Tax=Splendidivirga corallicola TaxID=3051826 RepID=A0ABT8KRZ9_9BACT|nr:tRNA (5-methylaminomethyl-2-thiouridine)(34)-methyltransferase MnmD [Fulvivirgaceae bacterium BMA10]